MEQLSLDLGITNIDDAMTDRQTDRQKAAEAHIVPRSSTFKKYGIIQTNGMGIIDNTYCGDDDQWMMPVYATRDTTIYFNERIAQFRIVENQPRLEFKAVEHLEEENRGGFGSTGRD